MAVSWSSFFFALIFFCNGVTLVRSTKKTSFQHVDRPELVEARRGENVTLACDFKMDRAIELSKLNVHWSKDGVTKYFSNKTCCDYNSGHDISEEDLQNGRAPLQLINVQDKDAGVYSCSIKYQEMEESWNTTLRIQDDLATRGYLSTQTVATSPRDDGSVVPESTRQHRTLKLGLVSGVLIVTGLLAVILYCCFEV